MNGNALCVHCLCSAVAPHPSGVIRWLIEKCFCFVAFLCIPNGIYCTLLITSAGWLEREPFRNIGSTLKSGVCLFVSLCGCLCRRLCVCANVFVLIM